MIHASPGRALRILVMVAPAMVTGTVASAYHDPSDPPPIDPVTAYGEEGDCTLPQWSSRKPCVDYFAERKKWQAREDARVKAAAEAAQKNQAAPASGQRTEKQFEALREQLEKLNEKSVSDTTLPLIEVYAPKWVAIGDNKRISGLVGDDGSPPRLKVNGETAPLFKPRTSDKNLAKHTLVFDIPIDAKQEGEREYLLEVCDAADNCVAQKVNVTVGSAVVDQPNSRSRNFALVIGNDRYDRLPYLKTAVRDATAVAEILIKRYTFSPERVRLLTNADRATTLRALLELRDEVGVDDRLLIYYAGHGQFDRVTNEGFWLPTDAVPDEDFTWIANDEVRRYLRGMPAKHVLLVADSCFSGSLTRAAPDLKSVASDRFFTEVDASVSRKVIASGGTEPVADAGSGGHSVFAYYFLKALRDNDQPYITSFELFHELVRAVANNSSQKPEFGTVADTGDEGSGDFTFIRRSGG